MMIDDDFVAGNSITRISIADGDMADARYFQNLIPEGILIFSDVIPMEREEKDLFLIEAKVFVMKIVDLAKDSDGREDQQNRQCKLDDHQSMPEPGHSWRPA